MAEKIRQRQGGGEGINIRLCSNTNGVTQLSVNPQIEYGIMGAETRGIPASPLYFPNADTIREELLLISYSLCIITIE